VIQEVFAGRYRLLAQLATGGMAAVYRATDLRLRRPVALKLLYDAGAEAAARLRREARVAALIEAPGLCRIFEFGCHDATLFLVMDLLDGETVHAHEHARPPDLGRSLRWVTSAAKTMSAVHQHGIVHRDLKPENLFIDRRGGAETLIVLDFGLAFVAGSDDPELGRLTGPDQTAGTPAYMAPEMLTGGEVGAPSDVYALEHRSV
jgi:eukaryotic-like serine/threonine-protein kinase